MFATLALLAAFASAGAITGAARAGDFIFTWGRELRRWHVASLDSELLARGDFAEGGCAVSLGGATGLVLQQRGGTLLWRNAVDGAVHTLDTAVDMHDCLGATLFGRRGVLVVQRGMQVRFYEMPREPARAWPYREIYSFYTASWQGGLALRDIDGDGRPDILCGNYWIRSPARFDLPWRLFAINTYSETERSATLRIAPVRGGIVVAQGELARARLTVFTMPGDVKQLWRELRVAEDLEYPHALAVVDWNGDGREDIVVGEKSRLGIWWSAGKRAYRWEQMAGGVEVFAVWPAGGRTLVSAGPDGVRRWAYRPRR